MKAFLRILIPVFATSVYGYCVFLFCSFAAADVTLDYPYFALLACAVFASVVNYRLSLREQTVMTVAIVNAALVVLTEIVGFAAKNEIEGVVLHAIAAVVFLAPVVHSLLLCRRSVSANAMLLFCEMSMAGTAVFMGLDLGYFDAPPRAFVLSVICLVLNLFLLSSLRTDAPAERKTEVKKQIERGVILTTVITLVVFAAGAIVVFALPAVRGALFGAVSAVSRFFVFLGKSITAFFVWLAEVLPDPPPLEEAVLPPGDTVSVSGAGEMEELLTEVPDFLKVLILAVIAAAVIAVIAVAVIKSRKKRLRLRARFVQATAEVMERGNSLTERLLAFWHFLLRRLSFARRLFALRNSYEGFFVRLSLIAKRKGQARAPSETAAAYLDRLTSALAPVLDSLDVPAGFLSEVAEQIDSRLYAPFTQKQSPDVFKPDPADRVFARRILRAARKTGYCSHSR